LSTYQTEDEQVEQLKKWWQENGKSIVGGAVVGLALVVGWQGWGRYTEGQAELAAEYYSEFSNTVRSGNPAQALEQGQRLMQQFDNSAYASYAALQLAKLAYQGGNAGEAAQRLQWVIDHAIDPALAEVARLRLGQLRLDQGDLDGARVLANAVVTDAFAGQAAELRGDIAMAAADMAAAATAYQQALAAGVDNADLVRMKLADTGLGPAN
jgi:predicted negative regulator of RcsB-dependent stress response